MFGFRKKQSSFQKTNVPAGTSAARYVKPTKKQLQQLRSEKRISNVPFGLKKKTRRQRVLRGIDTFQQGVRATNEVLDGLDSFGRRLPGSKLDRKRTSANFGAGNVSIPGVLKDPWGKL